MHVTDNVTTLSNMTNTENTMTIERLAEWVREHGNAVRVEGDTLVITSALVARDGEVTYIEERARTLREARDLLGY